MNLKSRKSLLSHNALIEYLNSHCGLRNRLPRRTFDDATELKSHTQRNDWGMRYRLTVCGYSYCRVSTVPVFVFAASGGSISTSGPANGIVR
jgi:hypothetical protein